MFYIPNNLKYFTTNEKQKIIKRNVTNSLLYKEKCLRNDLLKKKKYNK